MANRELFDVLNLPQPLRFDDRGELVASVGRRRVHFEPVHMSEPRLSVLEALPTEKTPHVIVSSHLSARARETIQSRGWGWIETNGNTHVETDGLLIHVERPAPTTLTGRGARSVPPQGERVLRYLLDSYPTGYRFTEIARATNLDKGYTSRILRRLADTGLVRYERNRPAEVISPSELFEFWQTMPPRTIESSWFVPRAATLRQLAVRITEAARSRGGNAFTGAFGANLLVAHLEPERIDTYVSDVRAAARLGDDLGAERVSRGANLVLLIHRDPGVLTIGSRDVRGLPVVSPSQLYRDALLRGRGREREAAHALRREVLKW